MKLDRSMQTRHITDRMARQSTAQARACPPFRACLPAVAARPSHLFPLLLCALLSGCGLGDAVHDQAAELGGLLNARCGWVADELPPFEPGASWSRLEADSECGFLPVGVSPCDHDPWADWPDDGVTRVQSWHYVGSSCGPYRIEWR